MQQSIQLSRSLFAQARQNHRIPHTPETLNSSLMWTTGEAIVLKREDPPVGRCRIATNVAWSCFNGSAGGYEWGYFGGGPRELAVNILNQFVPPGADGFAPVAGMARVDVYQPFNLMSKTAEVLASDFTREVLAKIPDSGKKISAKEIMRWIQANFSKVVDASRRESVSLPSLASARFSSAGARLVAPRRLARSSPSF